MRPTYAYIDLEALNKNIETIQHFAKTQKILFMVKANAYGCGIENIIPPLQKLSCLYGFGVASIDEAIKIRQLGVTKPIVLFEGVFFADEYDYVYEHKLDFMIHSNYQIEWLEKKKYLHDNSKNRVWLKINTGMNRLGFKTEDLPQSLDKLNKILNKLNNPILTTHLANSDQPMSKDNISQFYLVNKVYQQYSDYTWSIRNSCALLYCSDKNFPVINREIVRPGISIYGSYSNLAARRSCNNLRPVMKLYAKIIAIQKLQPGEYVGYGFTWRAERRSTIGVVSIGYGDGYPRNINEKSLVSIKGEFFPVIGRVSMDMLTIDITNSNGFISIGDDVELWGDNVPIELIAESAGTISYELLVKVTSRVNRICNKNNLP